MWVFGYGSLMWDDWEKDFEGTRVDGAALVNYHRSFNKKSTERWGTPKAPGPTLGLEPKQGERCVGTAFDIPGKHRDAVLAALAVREGKSFTLAPLEVALPDGTSVTALVPVNDRTKRTYAGTLSLDARVALAMKATGTGGACVSYIQNIGSKLKELGIEDAHIEAFLAEMKKRR